MKIEVLTPTPLPEFVLALLDEHFELRRLYAADDPEALVGNLAPRLRAIACAGSIMSGGMHFEVDAEFMTRFPKLEIVANLGVGYENVDAAWAGRHGIVVTNTPDVLTDEVADLAMGLLLATIRELPQAERYLRAGRWPTRPFRLTPTLRGRTLGIIGLGRIGAAIAARAAPFGLKIAYHGRRRQAVPFRYYEDVRELALACDVLMVAAPGGPETRGLVSAKVLEALGPEGVLINIARGSVVDEKALIEALQNGVILAAGLDVFADEPHVPPELIAMDNVVLLPHVGSGSRRTREDMGRLVMENLLSWAKGKAPLTPVAETPYADAARPRRAREEP